MKSASAGNEPSLGRSPPKQLFRMSLLVPQAELGIPCSTLGSTGGQQPSLSLTSAAPLWTIIALSLPTARPTSGWVLVLPVQVPPPLLLLLTAGL